MAGPPSCPLSINNAADLELSTRGVQSSLPRDFGLTYDAVLIACFSVHPLVAWASRQQYGRPRGQHDKDLCVTGIFEASIVTALSLLPPLDSVPPAPGKPPLPKAKWGIVTTGLFWKDHLTDGVHAFLGQRGGVAAEQERFAGVFCSGADAGDFHPPEDDHGHRDDESQHTDDGGRGKSSSNQHTAIKTEPRSPTPAPDEPEPTPLEKLGRAARELLRSDGRVRVVVLGCAGMAGLEATVREAAIDVYGEEEGRKVLVVDGVRAGVNVLDMMVRSRRLFAA